MQDLIKQFKREPSAAVVTRLLSVFPKADVYLVGGVIRDWLLKRSSKDVDFVISGVPAARLEHYLRTQGKVDAVGKTFGVLKFQPRGARLAEPIDIALPRTEHSLYLTGGYKEFKITTNYRLSIEEDLKRRDFTINALAWDVRRQKLIDPSGGLNDLAGRRIRAVGSPRLRFQEDYSRLLRALRLSVQLDFTTEESTWKALTGLIRQLGGGKVPREIIAKEFVCAFTAQPVQALDLFDQSGALRVLMPELLKMKGCQQEPRYHSEGDVWTHTRLALEMVYSSGFRKQFGTTPSAELIIALLLHDIGKPSVTKRLTNGRRVFYGHEIAGARLAEEICQRLALSSYNGLVNCQRLSWLIRSHMLVIHAEPSQLKPTTLERYFLDPSVPGQTLLHMMYADHAASRSTGGRPSLARFLATTRRLKAIQRAGYSRDGRVKKLLDGHSIMRILRLPAGPQIGQIQERLRLAQLSGKITTSAQARMFILTHYAPRTPNRKRRRTPR